MMEIERKILDISVPALVKKVGQAKKLFDGLVRVEYFDFPDARIRSAKDLLRVREFFPKKGAPYTEFVYKIYKGVKSGSKYFEEAEVKIPGSVMVTLGKIFKQMGLVRTCVYEKKRTLFAYKDCKIEIDTHPKIPSFVEIEAPSPKRIDAMIKILGLSEYEQSAESISELLRRKYPKISLNGLVFKKSK